MVVSHGSRHTFRTQSRRARHVFLVGEFNNWSHTAHEMRRSEGDGWEITVELPPGSYRFRYLTDDGQWLTDYAAFGLHPNRTGGWDSVVFVPERREATWVDEHDESSRRAPAAHDREALSA